MKTFILETAPFADNVGRAEIKADVFCKNEDFQEPGFDTRFNNMEITVDEEAVKGGFNLQLIENRYQELLAKAEELNMSLTVIDINESGSSVVLREVEEIITLTSDHKNPILPNTEVVFSAFSNMSGDVTDTADYKVDEDPMGDNTFTPSDEGEFVVVATFNDVESNPVTVVAEIPVPESITISTESEDVIYLENDDEYVVYNNTQKVIQFDATVFPEGSVQDVEDWAVKKVEGEGSTGISIDPSGELTVGTNSDTTYYEISCKSAEDGDIVGTFILRVKILV